MVLRRVAIALVMIATFTPALTSGPAGAADPTPLTDTAPVGAVGATAWIAGTIGPDGAVMRSNDTADPSATVNAVLAFAATGTHADLADDALGWLATHIDDVAQSGGADRPGALAQLILAVVAGGGDARHFGGTAAANDLIARLQATRTEVGADAGLYGDPDPYSSAYTQGLALAALAAADIADPLAAGWLIDRQCADGSWMPYRDAATVDCPPFDWDTFIGADSNTTAVAAMGLSAQGAEPNHDVTAWFAQTRSTTGGWSFVAAPDAQDDPNSTALAISALLALGQNPDTTGAGGAAVTPAARLLSFQLGCDAGDGDRGAFWFPGSFDPSPMSTGQAALALAGSALPVTVRSAPLSTVDPCALTTTTTTPATSTTVTTTATTTTTTTTTAATTTTTTAAVKGTTATRAASATASSSRANYAG